jgi:hypothetical protein
MTVAVRELKPEILMPGDPRLSPPALPGASAQARLTPDQIRDIQDIVWGATNEATEKAFKFAASMAKANMEEFEKRLASIEAPKPQVMAVEINGELKRLDSPAVPYLGEMIENAKLGLNTVLIGPKGCGKTTAAKQLAKAFGAKFRALTCTAGASETWIYGRQGPTGYLPSAFIEIAKDGGVFLLDEIDGADSNWGMAWNTILGNREFTNPISGEHIILHPDCIVIGAANTFGRGGDSVYTGRNRQDGALWERFTPIEVGYDLELEKRLCPDKLLLEKLWSARVELQKRKADEVVSTRWIDRAARLKAIGRPEAAIFKSMTAGWPTELVNQVGLGD